MPLMLASPVSFGAVRDARGSSTRMSATQGGIRVNTIFCRARLSSIVTVAAIGALALAVGCERSSSEKVEDGARDIGRGVSGAAEGAADKVVEGLEKADQKVGELVDD